MPASALECPQIHFGFSRSTATELRRLGAAIRRSDRYQSVFNIHLARMPFFRGATSKLNFNVVAHHDPASGFCLRFRDPLPVRLATHCFARQPLGA